MSSLSLSPALGSPDFEDVLWDGTRVPGAWAQGLSAAEIEAARNQPFTFNRFQQNVPLASVSGLERWVLGNVSPQMRSVLLLGLGLLLVVAVVKR